jgi:hypothetical protein
VGLARLGERRPTIILVAALTLLLLAGFTAIYFGVAGRNWKSTLTNEGSTPLDSSHPSQGDASPAEFEWDSTANEINALSADVEALEQKANQLWDMQPTPLSSESNLESMP